jgi:hypothetical protein
MYLIYVSATGCHLRGVFQIIGRRLQQANLDYRVLIVMSKGLFCL